MNLVRHQLLNVVDLKRSFLDKDLAIKPLELITLLILCY